MRAPKLVRHAGGAVALIAAAWMEDLGELFTEVGDLMAAVSERLMPTSELVGEWWDEVGDYWVEDEADCA